MQTKVNSIVVIVAKPSVVLPYFHQKFLIRVCDLNKSQTSSRTNIGEISLPQKQLPIPPYPIVNSFFLHLPMFVMHKPLVFLPHPPSCVIKLLLCHKGKHRMQVSILCSHRSEPVNQMTNNSLDISNALL